MGNIQRKKVKEGEREREKYKDIQRKEKMMRENTKRNRRNNSGDRDSDGQICLSATAEQ